LAGQWKCLLDGRQSLEFFEMNFNCGINLSATLLSASSGTERAEGANVVPAQEATAL
jgi:hypothetical protein